MNLAKRTNTKCPNITWLCDTAGVSRAGYYKWLSEKEKRTIREEQDRRDFDFILQAYQYRGINKGAKSIHMRLLHQDPPIIMNEKKIRRLMKKYGLVICQHFFVQFFKDAA